MIKENVSNFLASLPKKNPFGENVILVAAVKMQTPNAINEAIDAGICDIGDNHVQEFREKFDQINPHVRRHFIGHLQTNKVKYLIGKTFLYHSIDRLNLAEEISKRSQKANVTSNILLQINAGNEETKGGFTFDEIFDAYSQIKSLDGIKILGIMAMLPNTDDTQLLQQIAKRVRNVFDYLKLSDENITYLSMGMSGDYALCIECGANMIRIGTTLFGARKY